jgi:hypothetical protein
MPQTQSIVHTAVSQGPTIFSIDDVSNIYVKRAVAYWRSLCAGRRFPSRSDLTLRGMAPFLPYTVIIAVIDDGADYEYRYVGNAQRNAFKFDFKGIRLSQIESSAPEFGAILRAAYEDVRVTGIPYAVRAPNDHEIGKTNVHYHETTFFPLGTGEATVDHILIVGVQIPDPFWKLPDLALETLANPVGDLPLPR